MGDSMDISPLPHKAPYSYINEQPLPSPSPVDEDMASPCGELPTPPQFPEPQSEEPKPASAVEFVSP
jgi:M-phase inducer tyrosine phosphatase